MTRTIQLETARLQFFDWGAMIVWKDGAVLRGTPHYADHHYSVISHRCGYGDDRLRYAQEHEFVHVFICERLLQKPSCLWFLAHDMHVGPARSASEEVLVQNFQAWLRAGVEPIVSDVDWHGLKRDALALLDAPA